MNRIILADNQDITRAGLELILRQTYPDIDLTDILTVSPTVQHLMHHLTQSPQALIILDYALYDFPSTDALITVQQRFEDARWLLFSEELSLPFLQHVLYTCHNVSVVLKTCTRSEIVQALTAASRGEQFICSQVANQLQHSRNQDSHIPLTPTEINVLRLIALGKTTREVAALCYISYHTANTHCKNIYRKIAVNNRFEARRYAVRAGIIDSADYNI